MGTRAAFWIGDPVDLENREWLGCVAWDGHPENFEVFTDAEDEEQFRTMVKEIGEERDDFAHPKNGWPYPWANDIFLTDLTYAFFNGQTQCCWFYKPFEPLSALLNPDGEDERDDDPAHDKVPAPEKYNRAQPDSIVSVFVKKTSLEFS